MLKQVAVFVENKPGSLRKITTTLHENGISIYAFTSFDAPEFSILRTVVDQPEKAKEILTTRGFVNKICDVVAVQLKNEQGAIDKVLSCLMENDVNINYIYSSFGNENERSAVIVHTDDIFETEAFLKNKGFICL